MTTWGASCEDETYMKPDTYKALAEWYLCVLEPADSQKPVVNYSEILPASGQTISSLKSSMVLLFTS